MINNLNIKTDTIETIVTDNGENIVSSLKNKRFPQSFCTIHTISSFVQLTLKVSKPIILALKTEIEMDFPKWILINQINLLFHPFE